jgi:hypothetical protein
VVAHAAVSERSVAIAWPSRLTREERLEIAQARLPQLENQRQIIEEQIRRNTDLETSPLYFEGLRLDQEIANLQNESFSLYRWGVLYDRFFYRLAILLAARQSPLASLSFVACEESRLRQRYPSLQLVESRTDLRFGPSSPLGSFLFGGEKAGIDLDWIRRSLIAN